ncbi:MAG: hypothetical protein WDA60_06185 [Acidimicrobiia bacterium]
MDQQDVIQQRDEAVLCLAWWPLFVASVAAIFNAPIIGVVLVALALVDRVLLVGRIRRRGASAAMFGPNAWRTIGPHALSQAFRVLSNGPSS